MKRHIGFFMTVCVLCVLLIAGTARAEEWQNEGAVRWKYDSGVLTIAGSGAIPDYALYSDEVPWKKAYGTEIQKIVIESGVTRIGKHAFSFLSYMKSIEVPASVTSVGQNAFMDDDSLASVALPGVITVEEKAFMFCSNMASLSLPVAETIGSNAFDGCSGLRSLVMPKVRSIADGAFAGMPDVPVTCPCKYRKDLESCGIKSSNLIHSYVRVPAIPATATQDGSTEGSRCSVCQEWEPGHEPQIIPAGTVSEIHVTQIRLNKTAVTLYARKGTADTLQLTAAVLPSDAADKRIRWTSSNPKVAKVDQNGLVTVVTKKKGSCTITAEAMDGSGVRTAMKLEIRKNTAKLKKLTPAKKKLTLKVGKKATVRIKLKPSTVYNNKLKWKTSDKKIAKVTSKGVIRAIKKGKCVITAAATDGSGKKAVIRVTVK